MESILRAKFYDKNMYLFHSFFIVSICKDKEKV